MTSADRGRSHRGGPAARRGREGQGWNGSGWNGPGWNGPGDWQQNGWGGRGWVGDWREIGFDEPQDARRRNDAPAKRVRIGDAERDQAVSLLSDHFVAGRLTQAEFEERSEQATRSRYNDE